MYHQLRHWAYTTRNRVEEMLAPYRKPIMVPKLTSGMSKSERREARQLAAERKNEEANRLSKLLDEQGVIDEVSQSLTTSKSTEGTRVLTLHAMYSLSTGSSASWMSSSSRSRNRLSLLPSDRFGALSLRIHDEYKSLRVSVNLSA